MVLSGRRHPTTAGRTVMPPCDSGRRADFGGRWQAECSAIIVRHTLHSEGLAAPLHFCDKHMRQLIDAGLVPHVNVSEREVRDLYRHYGKDA